jgi:hypothetical protein
MTSASSSASSCLNNSSIKTTTSCIDLQNFLEWARDKIQVVWLTGCLTNSKSIDTFKKNYHKSVEALLDDIVNWVNDHEYHKDKHESDDESDDDNTYVFSFFNDSLGEEYDEYQEETMNPDELMECYIKTQNLTSSKNQRQRYDILDELQDIILDTRDFGKADSYISEHNIDIMECDVIMENAIGLEELDVAKYLIEKGLKLTKEMKKDLKRCNKEFKESFERIIVA